MTFSFFSWYLSHLMITDINLLSGYVGKFWWQQNSFIKSIYQSVHILRVKLLTGSYFDRMNLKSQVLSSGVDISIPLNHLDNVLKQLWSLENLLYKVYTHFHISMRIDIQNILNMSILDQLISQLFYIPY